MRPGKTCLSWEPSRCSTFSRNKSEVDPADLKSSNVHPASKQYCPIRLARQWAGRTGTNTTSGSDIDSSADQTPTHGKSYPDDVLSTTTSFNSSFNGLKTLPSRPKAAQGLYNKQAHRSVEENKLRSATKAQTDAANRSALAIDSSTAAVEVNVARSRCHPRRRPCSDAPAAATPKLRRDTDCTEAIVRLIVFFSTKLVHTIWSQASVTPKNSKDFNGAGVLPLQVFIQETLRRSKTSYSTLQVALFYLILLRPHVRPCQNTQQYTPNCRALQCGRRMFLTALILASKYLQDRNYSARAWSKISGLPVAEINENERHYLELIKYNLHMSKETFENWSRVVLTICKTSGQGPFGCKPDSPPSSPDGLSSSINSERPGSSAWWAHHLIRLTPDMVKDSKTTEGYLTGLTMNLPLVESDLLLDTPPSSPGSLEEMLSDHSSPLVVSSATAPQAVTTEPGPNPVSVGTMPTRPLPPNLPTPQTTPRHDSAFTFSRQSSQSDLRCRASLQALSGVEKQGFSQANLETCPPPRPRQCGVASSAIPHPLKEVAEPSVVSWMSSPESSFSDSSSSSSLTTRSRSSSISSVSSVWSVAGPCPKLNDIKQSSLPRMDHQPPCYSAQAQSRANVGSFSFYHRVGNMHMIPENSKLCNRSSTTDNLPPSSSFEMPRSEASKDSSKPGDLTDYQIAQLLASLSSQSDGQVEQRTDPAVISEPDEKALSKVNLGPSKKHKRSRSSKEECVLQQEVRDYLRNEQPHVCVKDDKMPTTYVETSDKEAQYPAQQWAHPKKPVSNAMHTKRIALSHSSSPRQASAPELAAEYLRQSVPVM